MNFASIDYRPSPATILLEEDAAEVRAHIMALLNFLEIERDSRRRHRLPVRRETAAIAVAINALDIMERNECG